MRIAFLGDIVGRPGRRAVGIVVRRLRREAEVRFVVANCENAANGRGVTPATAEELRDAGIDVLTSGNHVWSDRSVLQYIQESSRLLRPLNLPPMTPGRGWTLVEVQGVGPVAVVNLIGRVFMGPADCPFRAIDDVLPGIREHTSLILVDMHGEATSEKGAIAHHLDGRVSAVVGSHTHVQTADERLLPLGTAFLTDAGMCGPENSVLGVRVDRVLQRFQSALPVKFEVADGPIVVHGALIDVDVSSGRATRIERLRERVP